MILVVMAGHTWGWINRINYYVWLKELVEEGASDACAIMLDPEDIKQMEWSAHAIHLSHNPTNFHLISSRYS